MTRATTFEVGMLAPDEALSLVQAHFKRHHLHASDDWMKACVDWCLSETPNLNKIKLVESVRSQWLDTDIRTEGVQSRPQISPNAMHPDSLKPPPLQGPVVLQVCEAIDVSKPAYNQLQILNKIDNQNLEICADRTQVKSWQPPPPTRTLKLKLSDGFRTIDALEFERCSDLKDPVPLGLKLSLKNETEIRRGTLMLRPKNLNVLGGVVEEMVANCGLKTALENRLGQKQNPVLPTQQYTAPKIRPKIESGTKKRPLKSENPFADDDDDVFGEIPDEDFKMDAADDDIFNKIEIKVEEPSQKKPKVELPLGRPFQYLSALKKVSDPCITIKGCIVTLTGKLTVKPGPDGDKKWGLSVVVTDGSDTVNAALSSSLLSRWLEATPQQFAGFASDKKATVKANMKTLSQKLLRLNALLKLDVRSLEILEVIELNNGHAQQLKVRNK